MGYVVNTLATGEEILLVPKLHWWKYIKAILSTFIAFFIMMMMVYSDMTKHYLTEPVWTVMLLITLGYAFMEVVRNKFIEMACTNKRIVQKRGVLKRVADELQVSKVESLEIRQSVWGRIVGYGNLHFSGTGTSKADFLMVKNPLEVKAIAADILEKYKD